MNEPPIFKLTPDDEHCRFIAALTDGQFRIDVAISYEEAVRRFYNEPERWRDSRSEARERMERLVADAMEDQLRKRWVTELPVAQRAEIARLTKELEEANEAVIAAEMLGFEKGKDAAKAELAEARKVIEDGIDTIAMHQYPMGESGAMVVNHTEAEQWSLRARAFLAAKETKG